VGNDSVSPLLRIILNPERSIHWTLGKDSQILVLMSTSMAMFTSAANDPALIFSMM